MLFSRAKTSMIARDDALAGRDHPIVEPGLHEVLGTPLEPPFPEGTEHARRRDGLLLGR